MPRHTRSGLAILLGAFISTAAAQSQSPTAAPPPGAPDLRQQSPISVAELRNALGTPTTVTATVSAVDYEERIIVLRNADGVDHALYVGDEVKKLQNLKVGDRVQAIYYMSIASRVMQPGEPSRTGATESVVGTTGTRPGGTASYQQRWTVTVNAVDLQQRTVTVTGEKGRTFTFKVDDAAKLANVKAEDRVEIEFTAAALVSVLPAN